MLTKLLPSNCWRNQALDGPGGAVVHYLSAKNVAPELAFDMETCRDLLVDLNLPGMSRGTVLPVSGEGRVWASYHTIIGRDGTVWQLVPWDRQAYHAGVSAAAGRVDLNRWCSGHALVGTYGSGFTPEQYAALADVLAQDMAKGCFAADHVWGHDQVARPHGRKIDPGPRFDWAGLRAMLPQVTPP